MFEIWLSNFKLFRLQFLSYVIFYSFQSLCYNKKNIFGHICLRTQNTAFSYLKSMENAEFWGSKLHIKLWYGIRFCYFAHSIRWSFFFIHKFPISIQIYVASWNRRHSWPHTHWTHKIAHDFAPFEMLYALSELIWCKDFAQFSFSCTFNFTFVADGAHRECARVQSLNV